MSMVIDIHFWDDFFLNVFIFFLIETKKELEFHHDDFKVGANIAQE